MFWYAILTCRAVISDHVGMVVRPGDSCAVAGSVGGSGDFVHMRASVCAPETCIVTYKSISIVVCESVHL